MFSFGYLIIVIIMTTLNWKSTRRMQYYFVISGKLRDQYICIYMYI